MGLPGAYDVSLSDKVAESRLCGAEKMRSSARW